MPDRGDDATEAEFAAQPLIQLGRRPRVIERCWLSLKIFYFTGLLSCFIVD